MVQDKCQDDGLIVRAIGDRIAITPPLIITLDQIAEMLRMFRKGLDAAWAELKEKRSAAVS